MSINFRTAFFIVIGFILLLFLYIEREILSPFVLAAVFAYLFNPVVNFFSHKIRLPRTISIIIIYILILGTLVFLSIILTRRIISESEQLINLLNTTLAATKDKIDTLPDIIKPMVVELFASYEKLQFISSQSVFSLFPEAFSRIISFIIFLFSGFYFLKEGKDIIEKMLANLPKKYEKELKILFQRISTVLRQYLRGQLLLVFLVSLTLFIGLSILGVRFALLVAIFSGFAEIVPFIGPFVATLTVVLVVLITGENNFLLSPTTLALIVTGFYFVVRQVEDYFVSPLIMGKITKLHPLVILFAVLSGQHLFGILGLILAVPIAAILKILLEFSLEKMDEQKIS